MLMFYMAPGGFHKADWKENHHSIFQKKASKQSDFGQSTEKHILQEAFQQSIIHRGVGMYIDHLLGG